jgi:hypothetical protein
MRTGIGFCLALFLCTAIFAQNHATQPVLHGTIGSVVHPAGTAATGVVRTGGSVVNPGGGGVRLMVPGAVGSQTVRRSPVRGGAFVAYPVYIGGYSDSPYISQQPPVGYQQPQQSNITVVYPQQQVTPIIINMPGSNAMRSDEGTQPEPAAYESASPATEPTHYLIAFTDHTIYAAVAYWVDGETLHYFTAGNTHNQASVSLVDRPLTERLNKDSGVEVKLPAPSAK